MKIDKKSKKSGGISGSGTLSIDAKDWATAQERKDWGKGGGRLPLGTYVGEVVKSQLRTVKSSGPTDGSEQINLQIQVKGEDNNGVGGTAFFDATFYPTQIQHVANAFEVFGVTDDYVTEHGPNKPTDIKIPPASVVESWKGTKLKVTLTKGKPYIKDGKEVEGSPNVRIDPLEDAPKAGAKKAKKTKAAK